MNHIFERPSNGFSDGLTSKTILGKHERQEKQEYEKIKQRIQRDVLKYFNDMSWEFETPNISHSNLSKLESRVTKRGFSYKQEQAEYSPGGMGEFGGFTKPKIIISLPKKPIENDEGYDSDGWEPEFKASEIKNKIQKYLTKQYQELSGRIEAAILACPGYHEYTLKPKSISPIVMEWMKESLNERGFTMKHVSESCPGDAAGSCTEYSDYWKILNPQVKNYNCKEIYL